MDPKDKGGEEEEMMMEEGEEEMEEETVDPLKDEVMAAVQACFEEGGEAYDKGGDEAIDAVIAKLEAMKGGDKPTLGGLGESGEPMDLGEAE
jgi:hypothetical protein